MELKDVVLSTLAEMQSAQESEQTPPNKESIDTHNDMPEQTTHTKSKAVDEGEKVSDETMFLQSIRERLLVLFEGFQSPNNKQIEAKVDLTLNFLEYLLSTIDTRLDTINKGKK